MKMETLGKADRLRLLNQSEFIIDQLATKKGKALQKEIENLHKVFSELKFFKHFRRRSMRGTLDPEQKTLVQRGMDIVNGHVSAYRGSNSCTSKDYH